MYEANSPLPMLVLAGYFAVELRWPDLPRRTELGLAGFLLCFLVVNWWWTISPSIGRNLAFAIDMICWLLLLVVVGLRLARRMGPPQSEKAPNP